MVIDPLYFVFCFVFPLLLLCDKLVPISEASPVQSHTMVDKAMIMLPREDPLDRQLILEIAARLSVGRGCPVSSAGTAGGTLKSAAFFIASLPFGEDQV